MQKSAFIIAGTSSGTGKTTVTLALMATLRKRGLNIQPFKAGPDYIDPSHHSAVCGRDSYNLDTWMMGAEAVRRTFFRHMLQGDVGIAEGVMGLYDGRGGQNSEGSTAHLAKVLGIPVILVVDAAGMAGSAAALLQGFENFDSDVRIAGVIFNRVGSERHFAMLKEAVGNSCQARVLGYVLKNQEVSIPERHLGLVMAGEDAADYGSLTGLLEGTVDVDALLDCSHIDVQEVPEEIAAQSTESVTIAVAHDEAFCFYYRENLDILERCGARLAFFSPLEDETLPEGTAGIYLGGGYPELHAERLAANSLMRESIRSASEGGMPVYAECGGLMYLGQCLTDLEGYNFDMTGLFPWSSKMLPKRRSLGYREVMAVSDSPFMKTGETARGHEFHYSEIESAESVERCYVSRGSDGREEKEGYIYKNSLASYVHIHFASNPRFAQRFVAACRDWDRPVESNINEGV